METAHSIAAVRAALTTTLRDAHVEQPEIDVTVLLTHVLDCDRAWLAAHPEKEVESLAVARLEALVAARCSGTPMSHVLGSVPFCGMTIRVTPDTLAPRPETELLVESLIERRRATPPARIIDVGTGSGCIALALARAFPAADVLAVDVSEAALVVARENAHTNDVRIRFERRNLLEGIGREQLADLLVANLPYLTTEELDASAELRAEPRIALDGGADGNLLVEQLLQALPGRLAPGATVALELHPKNAKKTVTLAHELFPDAHVDIACDLSGAERFVLVQA